MTITKDTNCADCSRNHTDTQPCPRRIAKAVLTGDTELLSPADLKCGRAQLLHKQVEDVLEEWLADNLAT